MSELVKLKRSRATSRSWLQREVVKLQTILESKEPDQSELELALGEFSRRLASWDATQAAVEAALDEADVEDDIQSAGDFRDGCCTVQLKAVKLVRTQASQVGGEASSHGDGGSLKLPKIDLPKFSGNILEWSQFWESFAACVDSSDLPEISKLTYLLSLLKGEAQQCVAGLSLSGANYRVACELLKNRFGREELIIFGHVQALLGIPVTACSELQALQDQLLKHVRCLETLGVSGDKYGVVLTPLVLSKLPAEVRLEWAREGAGKESDLNFLLSFLKSEIDRQERSRAFCGLSPPAVGQQEQGPGQRPGRRVRRETSTPTAAALQASSSSSCGFCQRMHPSAKCQTFLRLTVSKRIARIKASELCLLCLQPGHRARDCGARCASCGGRHHVLCCFEAQKQQVRVDPTSGDGRAVSKPDSHPDSGGAAAHAASLSCNSAQGNQCIVLPTARVKVRGDKGPVEATVLFDSGSDRSYVSESLVKRVGAQWTDSKRVSYVAFGGGKSSDCVRDVFTLSVQGEAQSSPAVRIEAVQVPMICSPLRRPQVKQEVIDMLGLDQVQIADGYGASRQLTVDVLIGLDQYWKLMQPGVVRRVDGLVAQMSAFGWVLSGAVDGCAESSGVGCQLLTLGDLHEDAVRNLWSLEGIGVHTTEEPTSSKVLEDFDSSVRFTDENRYEVGLPWKEGGREQLLDNKPAAEGRLAGLSRRLARDPELADRYSAALSEMEQSGVIEEVPCEELESQHPTFYLPHHPVVKESSTSTKVRPVFDASSPGPNGVSLNDCVETGPCLIPSLVEVLLRFRRWRFAVTADIVKAFLQLQLKQEDRDVHRFLWECDGEVRVMRFLRVTFGVSSSPFLLNATIRHHHGGPFAEIATRE